MEVNTKLVLISLLAIGCGELEIDPTNPPSINDFPQPLRMNDHDDGLVITNGISYWKTESELNNDLLIRSSHCLVNGIIGLGRDFCYVSDALIDRQPTQVYRLNIGKASIGDIYSILGEFRSTNPNQFAPLIGSLIIASTNPNETLNFTHHEVLGTDPIVVPYTGYNCTKEQHHCVDVKVGSFMVTESMVNYFNNQDMWIIWIAWSHSTRYWENSKNIIIEANDGSLTVIKH